MNGLAMKTSALYCRRDMDGVDLHRFVGGTAAVFTTRSPEKETPNEDAAALIFNDEHSGALLVADGLGGLRSGELASQTVVDALNSSLEDSTGENGSLRTGILDGIEEGNRRLCEMAIGAATTLAIVELRQRTVRPFHVGDTVILIIGQRGKIKLQTISHSPIGFAVESGLLDEVDAIHHEDRHLVSNVVGTAEMRIEIGSEIKLAARDTLLIASDGLLDNLQVDEIVDRVRVGPLQRAVARLAKDAGQRMRNGDANSIHPSKPDDLTIVAFRPTSQAGEF
jgi:serine/threonine protein phosphatase PrpC